MPKSSVPGWGDMPNHACPRSRSMTTPSQGLMMLVPTPAFTPACTNTAMLRRHWACTCVAFPPLWAHIPHAFETRGARLPTTHANVVTQCFHLLLLKQNPQTSPKTSQQFAPQLQGKCNTGAHRTARLLYLRLLMRRNPCAYKASSLGLSSSSIRNLA